MELSDSAGRLPGLVCLFLLQAAYAVWALASLTRNIHVNRDLFVMVLKATLEIFMVKTADSDGSKMVIRNFVFTMDTHVYFNVKIFFI